VLIYEAGFLYIAVHPVFAALRLCEKSMNRFQAEFLTLFDTVTIIVGYAENKEEFTALAEQIYDGLKHITGCMTYTTITKASAHKNHQRQCRNSAGKGRRPHHFNA
jgi:hypothetical protein